MAMIVATDVRKEQALAAFEKLVAWPHWDEIALGARKEYALSAEHFQERLPEYQRFLALCAAYPGMGMVSEEIDVLWHSHILNTVRYDEVCERVLGRKVHHLPCSSYGLYGVEPRSAGSECTTCKLPIVPTTCYGQAVPDGSHEETRESILEAGRRFREAYAAVFGALPPVWGVCACEGS